MQIAGGRGGGAVTKCLPNGRMRLACPARLAGRCTIKSGAKKRPRKRLQGPKTKRVQLSKEERKTALKAAKAGGPKKEMPMLAAVSRPFNLPLARRFGKRGPNRTPARFHALRKSPVFASLLIARCAFIQRDCGRFASFFAPGFMVHRPASRRADCQRPNRRSGALRQPARPRPCVTFRFPCLAFFCGFCGFLLSFCCAFAAFPFVFAFRSMNPGFFTT